MPGETDWMISIGFTQAADGSWFRNSAGDRVVIRKAGDRTRMRPWYIEVDGVAHMMGDGRIIRYKDPWNAAYVWIEKKRTNGELW